MTQAQAEAEARRIVELAIIAAYRYTSCDIHIQRTIYTWSALNGVIL